MYKIINLGNNRKMEPVEEIEEGSGIEADKFHVSEIPGGVDQMRTDVSKAKVLLSYDHIFDLE